MRMLRSCLRIGYSLGSHHYSWTIVGSRNTHGLVEDSLTTTPCSDILLDYACNTPTHERGTWPQSSRVGRLFPAVKTRHDAISTFFLFLSPPSSSSSSFRSFFLFCVRKLLLSLLVNLLQTCVLLVRNWSWDKVIASFLVRWILRFLDFYFISVYIVSLNDKLSYRIFRGSFFKLFFDDIRACFFHFSKKTRRRN